MIVTIVGLVPHPELQRVDVTTKPDGIPFVCVAQTHDSVLVIVKVVVSGIVAYPVEPTLI